MTFFFLDIDMDGMNGIETAKILREKDKNVKIIICDKLMRNMCITLLRFMHLPIS